MKKNKSFSNFISEGGLWDNIRKARAAGKPKKKPGDKGYPKTLDIEGTEGYVSHAQRAAVWANRADGGKGHPDNKKKKKSKKEAYEPITTKRQQALAKAASEPKKPVTLPRAPWDKGTKVTYDKNGKVVKEASEEGATKIIKTKDNMAQVQRMTKGKFVNHGKPYKSAKDAEKVRSSGQHSMQFDSPAKKKPVSQMSSAEKKTNDERRKAYKDFQKSKRNQTEGAMKRMSTGDGMDTYRKKPDEVKSINKGLMKNRNNPQEKDKDVKKINKSLAQMRGEAFSARAIVKKPRAGDGKPMSNKPMVRSNSPEHKAAVKKYVSGMKSKRPGNTTSTLPRQMKDPKKDAMVAKGGKVKVVDKSKEADHLKRGYVRAEDTISKELFMKEAKTMMVTHPKTPNKEIKITSDQWPSFKMRGYHHAEQAIKEISQKTKDSYVSRASGQAQVGAVASKHLKGDEKAKNDKMVKKRQAGIKTAVKENMMTMKLINKMKKASPAAKKALEAPSRVDNKDDKKVNELTIADVRKATEKAKKRQEKERKATGKTSTSTTDLASRNEAKEFKPHMMYDPKTGKGYKANKEADHLRMKKMGYTHDDPATKKMEESFITEKAKKGLAAKAEKSGMPLSVLRSVYNRGMAAWKTGHRPGTTPQQWAMARVNSFTTKSSGTWGGADKDLAAKVRKEDVNPNCECEDCQCNPCECNDWRADMGPGAGGIPTNQAEKLGEAKMTKICEDCGCKYGNIDPDCDCPNDGSDPMGEHWTLEPHTEALDMKQRLARGRSARKNKAKLAMGRKKAGRRIASMAVLKKRARRAARKTLTKRLTKGIAKTDLTVSRKKEIEKRLDKPAFKIKANRLVKRTIKDIRKKEIARKRK